MKDWIACGERASGSSEISFSIEMTGAALEVLAELIRNSWGYLSVSGSSSAS
jgi:hypothetical protein